jgi:signal transduction histidine kinase
MRCDTALVQARRLLKSDPAAALQRGRQALVLARQLADAKRQGQSLTLLATAADYAGEAKEALHFGQQALALARQHDDSVAAAHACHGLSSILADRNDTTSAGNYLRQGLRLIPAGPVGYGLRGALLNGMATLDYNANRFQLALNRALVAQRFTQQAEHPSPTMLSSTEGLIAACYSDLGDEERARRIISQVLARDRRTGQLPQVVENMTTLSHSLLKDRPRAGLDTLQKALALTRQLNLRERTLDCYEEYFRYYARVGRYREAYAWRERYQLLDDSINERQQQEAMMALNSKYEVRARDQEIQALNQRSRLEEAARRQQQARNRQLLALVGLLALSLGGAATFAWKLKRRDQLLASQNAALVAATAEARAHAAARDRLYSIVAHDLRGPVASFGGVSQLIELYLQQKDGAGLQQVTALVRQTARNLSELLHNLLGWTMSQTGDLSYTPEDLLLAPVLAEIKHLYSASAKNRHVNFELGPTPPTLYIWADSQMVQTILRNLVGNALKFAPENGHLRLSATPVEGPDGAMVCLEVADNGSGMSATQIQRILGSAPGDAPLPPTHDPRAGTGLGLSLCLAFVRRLGGTLTIESEPGTGTTVRVTLPVKAPVNAQQTEAATL